MFSTWFNWWHTLLSAKQLQPKLPLWFHWILSTSGDSWLLKIMFYFIKFNSDLSELRVTQLLRPQPAEGPVQLKQLLCAAVQPPADQESREAWRQEEQGTDVSLIGHEDRHKSQCLGSPQLLPLIWTERATSVREGGAEGVPTMWSTVILLMPRGGPENRRRTARISDTWGFSPFCTWRSSESQFSFNPAV